jgi:hypothetical protein
MVAAHQTAWLKHKELKFKTKKYVKYILLKNKKGGRKSSSQQRRRSEIEHKNRKCHKSNYLVMSPGGGSKPRQTWLTGQVSGKR